VPGAEDASVAGISFGVAATDFAALSWTAAGGSCGAGSVEIEEVRPSVVNDEVTAGAG